MDVRKAEIKRDTAETKISLSLSLDGKGKSDINTGCGFLDHMLTLFASHGRFDLSVECKGDVEVDYHHSVEDIGISLGKAFASAIGDCKGIRRYGNMMLPMDDALILCALDVSGRDYLSYGLNIPTEKIGDFDSELVEEFFLGFVRHAGVTLHVKQLDGRNSHHIAEGAFKAFARALRIAVEIDDKRADVIPSTKGVL
jgi:imidazoleglycerol-phosphate dehydratase